MKIRPLLLLVSVCFAIALSTAFSATSPAEQRLQGAVNEFLKIAQRASNGTELAKNIQPVLEKYVSFDAMTRRSIGPGWRQFSPGEQSKAVELFTTLVIRSYSDKLTPGELPKIDFRPASTTAPDRVDIPTTFIYKGSKYDVTYRMEKTDDWRITDVVIEGVSFVANYRSQFDPIFKRGGVQAILSSLNQSVQGQR